MTLQYGLKDKMIQRIRDVLAQHQEVDRVLLYGSRAMGNYKNGSDIDVTLIGGDDLTLDIMYRIMDEIDDLLLPYMFDVSIFKTIDDESLLDHIRRVGVTFYEREADRVTSKRDEEGER